MTIKLLNFPNTKVRACCSEDEDGNLIVFVNARHAEAQRVLSYLHEVEHEGDFQKNNVQSIERETHER